MTTPIAIASAGLPQGFASATVQPITDTLNKIGVIPVGKKLRTPFNIP